MRPGERVHADQLVAAEHREHRLVHLTEDLPAVADAIAVQVRALIREAVAVVVEAVAGLAVPLIAEPVGVGVGEPLVDRAIAVIVEAVAHLRVERVAEPVAVGVGLTLIDDAVAIVVRAVAGLDVAAQAELGSEPQVRRARGAAGAPNRRPDAQRAVGRERRRGPR